MTVSLIARATAPLVLVIAGLITLSTTLGGQIQTRASLAYSDLKPGYCTAAMATGRLVSGAARPALAAAVSDPADVRLQRLAAYHLRNAQ
ncbi:MAG: hypothetical protein M3Z21_17450 [Pseudomonadota bacterium]|nr:hypothetical protein [Pseudomonadota bacterium]